MPNDNLKKYYSYLKSNGADVAPTYDSFVSTLSNEANAKKYYSYLQSSGFDTPPSYDQFANTLGIKKKRSYGFWIRNVFIGQIVQHNNKAYGIFVFKR